MGYSQPRMIFSAGFTAFLKLYISDTDVIVKCYFGVAGALSFCAPYCAETLAGPRPQLPVDIVG
jgi:hypothetical protein